MSISISNDTEAIAAVAVVVTGADGIGSIQEQSTLFGRLASMDAFAEIDEAGIATLVGSVTGNLVDNLSTTETGAFSPESIDTVFAAAANVLDSTLRVATFNFAAELMMSDEQAGSLMGDTSEIACMRQLRSAFEL